MPANIVERYVIRLVLREMTNEYVVPHCSRSELPRILIRAAWQHDGMESSLKPGLHFCSVYDVRTDYAGHLLPRPFRVETQRDARQARQKRWRVRRGLPKLGRTHSEYPCSASWFFSIK
jgi:hypothetical protein